MRVKLWIFTFTVFAIVACGVRRLEAIPSFKEEDPVEVKALVHCSCSDSREWDEAE